MAGVAFSQCLLIDSDPNTKVQFGSVLNDICPSSVVADSAGAALDLAKIHPYSVVIIDLYLEGMDAGTAMDAFRAIHEDTVFILTGASASGLFTGRFENNASIAGFIAKPWDLHDLASKISLAKDLYEKRVARHAALQQGGERSVLVVEDNPADRMLLQRALLLGDPHLHIGMAGTLADACAALHDFAYDVIITDLSLPDACGSDTVLRLRATSPNAVLIVSSSIEDEALSLQLIQMGAQDCIPKNAITAEHLVRALAFACERKRFEARLINMAYHDPLTGLANRAGWNVHAADALERGVRRGERAAAIMIDIDEFKSINDKYGHHVGDEVLQEVARRLMRAFRPYDIVARFGGDEFTALVTDLGHDADASVIAARARELLGSIFVLRDGRTLQLSASFGIAIFPDHGDTLLHLLDAADDAMYRSKHMGKNCVMTATHDKLKAPHTYA